MHVLSGDGIILRGEQPEQKPIFYQGIKTTLIE